MTTLKLTANQVRALKSALHAAIYSANETIKECSVVKVRKSGQSVAVAIRGKGKRVSYWRNMLDRWMNLLWKLRDL